MSLPLATLRRQAGPRSFEKVDVEFVSANPTGPLHVGHARNAARRRAGPAVLVRRARRHARVLHQRLRVPGRELRAFGAGAVRVVKRSRRTATSASTSRRWRWRSRRCGAAGRRGRRRGRGDDGRRARASLHAFGVEFDVWFSERSLHERDGSGRSGVSHGFDVLAEQGHSFTSEGALWLRTTDFGDDKDRVIEACPPASTPASPPTSPTAQNKRERGFDRMVYVLGADHHGYIGRMRAAYQALGGDPDRLDLLIMQFVHLVRAGEKVSMSTARGRVRHARRSGRGDRRRRVALVLAQPLARHDDRARSGAGDERELRVPVPCSMRMRGSRRCCARRARRAWSRWPPARQQVWRSTRPSGRWSARCWRGRRKRSGRSARRFIGWRPTPMSWRRRSRPSTGTARWWMSSRRARVLRIALSVAARR